MTQALSLFPRYAAAVRVRWDRWRARVIALLLGQAAVQLIGFVTGMLLLRWMSVDAYARYGVVFGLQCVFGVFVDLGVGGSIVSLVGSRGDQPAVIGSYIAAARWWRNLLFAAMAPISAIVFLAIGRRQHWPLADCGVLFLCLLGSLYAAGWNAWAAAPLLIHQQVRKMYGLQTAAALIRMAVCAALFGLHVLNAASLSVANTLLALAIAWSYWRAATPFFHLPDHSSARLRREMFDYLAPLLPMVAFFALQGQISTLLISFFGRSQSIAEVTALGRLGQLFTLLAAFHGTLVVPYFARLARELLFSRYLLVTTGLFALAALLSAGVFLFPAPFLWVLGPKYQHLRAEIGWMVLANSLSFVSSGLWSIHCARKWIFWSGSIIYIGAITVTQLLFVLSVDLSGTLHVLYLNVVTNLAVLATLFVTAWLGFRQPPEPPGESPVLAPA